MKKLLCTILFLVISINADASFIASSSGKINSNSTTHVLVAGSPDKLGELFIYSLLTRARIYLDNDPQSQIIIVGRSEDKEIIQDAGFKIVKSKSGLLKADMIKESISQIKSIQSLDIYAHSNALSGVSLDSNSWVTQLLNEKDDLWTMFATKLSPETYIFIHGCNAGIKLAPALASKLKIAVFAALTSTDFQYIYNDSFWAFDYNADNKNLSSKNILNYKKDFRCGKYCTRMKPDNSSYKGHWGDWSAGGYPTFKLFCGSQDNKNCERGAIEAISSFPGPQKSSQVKSSLENFKKQVIDFMCPFAHNSDKQNLCQSNLENSITDSSLASYSPFKGKTLVCDRIRCKAHFNCSFGNAAFNPGNCKLESEAKEGEISNSFTDEYKYFIEIFNKNVMK